MFHHIMSDLTIIIDHWALCHKYGTDKKEAVQFHKLKKQNTTLPFVIATMTAHVKVNSYCSENLAKFTYKIHEIVTESWLVLDHIGCTFCQSDLRKERIHTWYHLPSCNCPLSCTNVQCSTKVVCVTGHVSSL